LHIDECRANFTGTEKKKDEDLNSSSDSLESPLITWLWVLFIRIKNKFLINNVKFTYIYFYIHNFFNALIL